MWDIVSTAALPKTRAMINRNTPVAQVVGYKRPVLSQASDVCLIQTSFRRTSAS
jgi:hypothetical protein